MFNTEQQRKWFKNRGLFELKVFSQFFVVQDSRYALAAKCFAAAGQPSAAADTLIKIGTGICTDIF